MIVFLVELIRGGCGIEAHPWSAAASVLLA